jgi:epoxyqueuosine reductase
MKSDGSSIEKTILAKAKELGVSLAGIARIEDLRASKSYEVYAKSPFYEQYDPKSPNYFKFKGVKWREEHKSVLVWALAHPASEPALDWWSMKVKGFTPGNGVMRLQSKKLRIWMGEEYNLLVTPEFGTRVRLRGIFMEAELEPTGPIDFDPCNGCDRPCHQVCPRDAFRNGSFERALCMQENDKREAETEVIEGAIMGIEEPSEVSKPCRFCEFACPVAQGSPS